MPLDVTCPGCRARFQVSEKFAGKKGPCPKCKAIISVPTLQEQVVIHAPEAEGPKDRSGKPVFTPLLRQETRLTREQAFAIGGAVVVVLLGAIVLRFAARPVSPWITGLGAIVLAPALAFAGYAFLRDDELEPYRGRDVWLRVGLCTLVYPLLWGAYWLVFGYLGIEPQLLYLLFVIPAVIAIGAVTAIAAFDFDFGPAAMHYSLYLIATLLLRLLMGMNALWEK
jgi:hypothetical protein